MYKPPGEGGFDLLDEHHSPGSTARYVKDIGDDRAVVEVTTSGKLHDYKVYQALETASSPIMWKEATVVAQEQVASGVPQKKAYDIATRLMFDTAWVDDLKRSGNNQADSDFMF